jgi:RimJ/RimL family protein N-acetyltransferase
VDLVGELVRLRAPRPVDAERLLAIRSDPDLARFGHPPALLPDTLERIRESLTRRSPDYVRWAIECRGDGAILGCGIVFRVDYRNRNAWLGLEIGPASRWDRGYGTEAIRLMTGFGFLQLGLEKLYLGVYEGNERALRAYAKAGYRVEAALRRHHRLGDRLVTEYWLATNRDQHLGSRPADPPLSGLDS